MANQAAQDELREVLRDLRGELRTASFSRIDHISGKLETVFERLASQPDGLEDHEFVVSEMNRLQSLITSSINGVQSAQKKVLQYGSPKAEFVTYTSTANLVKS